MKVISILLALVNSLAAGLLITASLPAIHLLRMGACLWQLTKVTASVGIIAVGVLTWIAACRSTNQNLILLAGLFLVALGTASAVWTIHLALVSGNVKDHMFLYGSSLIAQGASCIWTLLPAGKNGATTS